MKKLPFRTRFLNGTRLIFRNRLGESLLIPLTSGKKWDQSIAKVPANYYQYKKGSWRNVQRNGFQLELDISDYMQWLLYFGILAEPRETLYQLIRPGMLVLDIGANIGETTLAFSKLSGNNGNVISFEPDPETFIRLEKHISINDCKNVRIVNLGLGNRESEMFLESGENNSGGNRIAPGDEKKGKKISITTLDNFLLSLNLVKVDFIKIDVEGYEYHVLQGAKKTIQKYHPAFFIEVVDEFLRAQGSSAKQLVADLLAENYKIKNANDQAEVNAETDFENCHFDIIAIPA